MNCGRCHRCQTKVRIVLDGEEWCPNCKQYQRPRSHGWASGDDSRCAPEAQLARLELLDSYSFSAVVGPAPSLPPGRVRGRDLERRRKD
jgi:hypothetical protein